MQLPRGTFREIRRSVTIESLLHDLEREKFSGVANISSQSLTGTLVFKTGKCILSKFQNSRGDAAWYELQKNGRDEVDAALALLGDAQIELALEFNRQFKIQTPETHSPVRDLHRANAPPASREPLRAVPAQKPAPSVAALKATAKPAPAPHHVPAPRTVPQSPSLPPRLPPFSKAAAPVPPSPPNQVLQQDNGEKREAGRPAEKGHENSSFEEDLDTFDTMDFDNVTDKIRTDCKTMIKQLHLDHLMER